MNIENLFQILGIDEFNKLDVPSVEGESCYHFQRFSKDNNNIISDNYVVYLTQSILDAYDNFSMDDYNKGFPHFESELLDNIFFNYDDDKRWNIYLYIAYDNEKFLNEVPIEKIEMDDNYALKSFANISNEKESLSLLSDKWFTDIIPQSNKDLDGYDIVSVWEQKLSKLGLEDFLKNDKISDNDIKRYIETQQIKKISTTKKTLNKETKQIHLDEIKSILFSHFREFCFGKEGVELFPGKMNILYGVNGSGKTSTLEAISYAITGYSNETYHAVIKSTNDETFDSQGVNASSYGRAWYNAPIVQCSQLNRYFKNFNYFDYERPYNFAKNKNEKFDELISNLFYDEDTIRMQKTIKRLIDKFSDIEKTYDLQKSDLLKQLLEIETQISVLRKDNDVSKISTELLSAMKDTLYIEDLSNNDIRALAINILIAAQPCKKAIENAKPYLVQYEYISNKNIQSEMVLINQKLAALKKVEEKYSPLLERETNLEKEKNNAIKYLDDIASVSQKVENLLNLNRKLNLRNTSEMQGLEGKFNDFIATVNNAKKTYEDCKKYTDYVLLGLSQYEGYNNQLSDLISELKINEKSKVDLQNSIEKIEQEAGYLDSLKSSINEMGKTLVMKKNIKSCPLCGFPYDSAQLLIKAMEKSASSLDNFKSNDYAVNKQKLLVTESNINKTQEEISAHKNILQYIDLLLRLHDLLKKSELIVNFNTIAEININFDDELQQLLDKKQMAKEVTEVFNIIKQDAIFVEFKNKLRNGSIQDFKSYLEQIRNNAETNYAKILDSSKENNETLKIIENEMSKQGISNISNQKKELIAKSDILYKTFDSIELAKKQFSIKNDYNLIHWIITLSNLEEKLNIFKKVSSDSNEILRLEGELNKGKNTLEKNKGFFEKCNSVINALKALPKTSDYASKFINDNKESIEKIFLLIHRPKEFDDVDFYEGMPVVKRKNSGDVYVTPDNMSAGQKVSFALAVMFTLYLSAKSAPRILLLDEPVVNMDEMHFSNLVEILRELVLNGTQIFITTANKEVLGYLKRKFSFLNDNLKIYQFDRDVYGSKVEIKKL